MQLVELQRTVVDANSGVAVAAISYDPVSVLSEFSAEHGITYPLLSDAGSATIRRLGLLNTQIVQDQASWGKPVTERHQGLPFPGTFMLDEAGVVVDKVFERSHRIRPGGGVLLERLGRRTPGVPGGTAEAPAVAMRATVDTDRYFPNQIMRATVRLAIEEGYHLYVPPNPDGFTDLTVTLGGSDGIIALEPEMPDGRPFRVDGFDETFTVTDGDVEVVVPFYIREDLGSVALEIAASFQACNANSCLIPTSLDVRIDLTEIRA